MSEQFVVQIIESKKNGKVIKEMGPMSKRRAEKVEKGININLNHERFYTELKPHQS